MKSKIDQRSPSRFSTGVPVSAMRACASSCFAGARLLGAGILDRLRLVEHDELPRDRRQPGNAQQRAVARDHEIDVREPSLIERLQLGGRHRRRMRDERAQARREALDLRAQLASSDAGATSRLGPPLVRSPSSLSEHQQQRQHLHRLAEAHVVGEAGAEAERREQMQPAHAGLLIGPQRRLAASRARIDARERVGMTQACERLGQPRTGDDAATSRAAGVGWRASPDDVRAGDQAHRLGEAEAALGRRPLDAPETRRACARACSRSPRPSGRGRDAGRRTPRAAAAISAAVSGSPSSVTSIWKSSSASAPSPTAACRRPSRSPAAAAGGSRRHVPGTRTTTPAASSAGRSVSSWNASRGVQRSGW